MRDAAAMDEVRVTEGQDWAGTHVHMIGIGGCGMSAAAALLLRNGAKVSGSDAKPFEGLGALVAQGAMVYIGHDASHLPVGVERVVISAAIPENNAEWAAARRGGVPVIRYAQLLGELMATRRGVAIAGTHGKSTTTALMTYLLRCGGLDPSFVMGARSGQLGGSSGAGRGRHFVVEACEYGRSFLELQPCVAGILNIDADHLDFYKDLDEIRAAFRTFAGSVRPGGVLLTPHAERCCATFTKNAGVCHETFGFRNGADWQADNLRPDCGCYAFDVLYRNRRVLSAQLRLAGMHNVSNALMATALAYHESVDPETIAAGLGAFDGIDRRMSRRDAGRGITIIDDYAHHPTEIAATLQAITARYEHNRTWVVFQPHQASRTRLLMNEFAQAFSAADVIVVADIFSVRDSEADRTGVRSSDLVSLIHQNGGDARYVGGMADVTRHVMENVADGDLVVTMGAGDVWKIADELARRIPRTN